MLPNKCLKNLNRAHRRALARSVRRFAKKEDGTLLIFGVYVFVMMLMVVGWGIDLMHYERERAALQYTLDRAVLAAADLDQTLPPEEVVADYFEKSGLGESLSGVSVSEGLNYREVFASAEIEMNTQFMHMTGIDTLTAPALSKAEERVDAVEISLVLDVSGSMNSNNRLPNLRVAAKDFVDSMDANTEDDKLSISIVPYATQVSIPQSLFAQLNTSEEHDYSRCLNFEFNHFDQTEIAASTPYQRTMHFDPWYYYDGRKDDPVAIVGMDEGLDSSLPVCEALSSREALVMQQDPEALKSYIDNLIGRGNTSIDIGMKWGTAMLDPLFNDLVGTMISDGDVPAVFADRPYSFEETNTLKVVVVMSDGQNTSQYFINDDFRTGDSDVFWHEETQVYSILNPDDNLYYQYDEAGQFYGRWADYPYGQDGAGCHESDAGGAWECGNWTFDGDDPVRLEYPDLWARTSVAQNAYYNYYPWYDSNNIWNDWYYNVRNYVAYDEKDLRTKEICDTAKDAGIVVFSIGFEAPTRGQTVLKECASSPAHYYDVDGLEIADAFSSIASSIRKLRLTQ